MIVISCVAIGLLLVGFAIAWSAERALAGFLGGVIWWAGIALFFVGAVLLFTPVRQWLEERLADIVRLR